MGVAAHDKRHRLDAQVVDIVERAHVLAPARRAYRDKAIVWAFLGKDDRMRPSKRDLSSAFDAVS